MPERWLPIPGWPGYDVSDQGRVRSWKRCGTGEPRMRRTAVDKRGYEYLSLCKDGQMGSGKVHHLVALAFIGPRPEGDIHVRHLDNDKANNSLDNLAYGTRSENTYDSVRDGSHPMTRKTHCKHGHPFDEQNTRVVVVNGYPNRYCRACKAGWDRRRWTRLTSKALAS